MDNDEGYRLTKSMGLMIATIISGFIVGRTICYLFGLITVIQFSRKIFSSKNPTPNYLIMLKMLG